jgi:stress response protein SCP2
LGSQQVIRGTKAEEMETIVSGKNRDAEGNGNDEFSSRDLKKKASMFSQLHFHVTSCQLTCSRKINSQ